MTMELNAVAQFAASRMVDVVAEGTLVALFAAGLLRISRRQSPSTRFAIWFSALLLMALVPLVGGAFSAWSGIPRVGSATVTIPSEWAFYVFGLWAVVAGVLLLNILRSLWKIHVIRKDCTPLDASSVPAEVQAILNCNWIGRRATICSSNRLKIPAVLGLLRPAIVIPEWALTELTSPELRQVVLHEMAHLRRADGWTNLAQQILRALLFFHPAVWWIENKLAFERELACDDAVLAETGSPRTYAECLAHLAEKSFVYRSLALAQAAIGRVRQTSARVARILEGPRQHSTRIQRIALTSMMGVFAVVCAAVVVKAPKLVGFVNDTPVQFVRADMPAPATSSAEAARVIPAKLRTSGQKARTGLAPVRTPAVAKANPNRLVHLTKSHPVPVAETVLLVIHSEANNYEQVQMWRVTLLRYVPSPAQIVSPSKKT